MDRGGAICVASVCAGPPKQVRDVAHCRGALPAAAAATGAGGEMGGLAAGARGPPTSRMGARAGGGAARWLMEALCRSSGGSSGRGPSAVGWRS